MKKPTDKLCHQQTALLLALRKQDQTEFDILPYPFWYLKTTPLLYHLFEIQYFRYCFYLWCSLDLSSPRLSTDLTWHPVRYALLALNPLTLPKTQHWPYLPPCQVCLAGSQLSTLSKPQHWPYLAPCQVCLAGPLYLFFFGLVHHTQAIVFVTVKIAILWLWKWPFLYCLPWLSMSNLDWTEASDAGWRFCGHENSHSVAVKTATPALACPDSLCLILFGLVSQIQAIVFVVVNTAILWLWKQPLLH